MMSLGLQRLGSALVVGDGRRRRAASRQAAAIASASSSVTPGCGPRARPRATRRPAPVSGAGGVDAALSACVARVQAPVVAALGDERADVGVHAPGLGQQHAALGRDRVRAVEQVLEHRRPGAAGVGGLGDLRQLLRVAEQHDRRARSAPAATASASANWPASSTNSRSNASRCSSRANSQAVPATSWYSRGHVACCRRPSSISPCGLS